MKVLLAPTNFANQPFELTRALRARGVDARHLLYAWKGRVPYAFDHGELVQVDRSNWLSTQLETVTRKLEEGVEIFHLWNRSLVYGPGGYGFFNGLDLPFLKRAGCSVIYRFTGYELRRRSLDMKLNPYSPYHRGLELPYDERTQALYVDFLREWIDCFVVQDPEMGAFLPEAEIVPRGLDLERFRAAGPGLNERPLVVHAPSSPELKGTEHIVDAVQTLQRRGIRLDFKLIENMDHRQALDWYRRADVVVDQLLIGWYGVVAIEAMALGKPLIAYVREPLYSEFRPRLPIVNANPTDLVERLAELVADSERREEIGRESRRFVEDVHDIRRVAASMESIYHRATEGPHGVDARAAPRYQTALAAEPLRWEASERMVVQLKKRLAGLNQERAVVNAMKAALRDLLKRFAATTPDARPKDLETVLKAYDTFVPELPKLRWKARMYDETQISTLRHKAKMHDELCAEVIELRGRLRTLERQLEQARDGTGAVRLSYKERRR